MQQFFFKVYNRVKQINPTKSTLARDIYEPTKFFLLALTQLMQADELNESAY